MRKFLVTGGAGFIGSHLAEALVRRGDQVVVLDNLVSGNRENLQAVNDQVEFVEGDVTDVDLVQQLTQGVDCIFHQAALASVPLSVERPQDTHHACATGTLNILQQAQLNGVRRVVYAASSSCYGDQPTSAKRETDPPQPLSPYAAAKLTGELYCQAFYQTFGLETVSLRYFNVFGPRQDPDSPYSAVIPIFITKLLAGQSPVIYGDGMQSRDFTYVSNVVDGNLLAADSEHAVGKSINLANGRSTSLLTLIAQLQRLLAVDLQPTHEPPRIGDVRDSMADITMAQQLLNYVPQVGFEDGLERSIAYYRELVQSAPESRA